MSIMFNEICINEEKLPISIYVCVCVYKHTPAIASDIFIKP